MALSRTARTLALTMALVVPATGCAMTAPRGPEVVCEQRFSSSRSHPVTGDMDFVSDHSEVGGLSPTHHGGERAGLIVAAIFLFPIVVLVDLLTLPVCAPCHREFYCTRAVVHHCCR